MLEHQTQGCYLLKIDFTRSLFKMEGIFINLIAFLQRVIITVSNVEKIFERLFALFWWSLFKESALDSVQRCLVPFQIFRMR